MQELPFQMQSELHHLSPQPFGLLQKVVGHSAQEGAACKPQFTT